MTNDSTGRFTLLLVAAVTVMTSGRSDSPTKPWTPITSMTTTSMTRWRSGATGKVFGLAISRSRVQILLEATLRNNLRQVVYTYVPLSTSSITWYRPKGGDALRLGR